MGSNPIFSVLFFKFLTLKVKGSIIICRALLKYGHASFSLDILKYCESNLLINRGQYYIDFLEFEYNTLKVTGVY